MQNPDLAAHVHEILGYGLDLYERLSRNEDADFPSEHGRLLQMLFAGGEVSRNPDYAGDGRFFGAQYALACWLDELFILDSPWSADWEQHAAEVAVVGGDTQQRAWRFWEMAELARKRPGTDAVEVYLWCVMLGFRGDPTSPQAGEVDPLAWADGVRKNLIKLRNQKFPFPAGGSPRPDVPVLGGRRGFVRMLRVATVAVAAALLVGGYLLTSRPAAPKARGAAPPPPWPAAAG